MAIMGILCRECALLRVDFLGLLGLCGLSASPSVVLQLVAGYGRVILCINK